jgi:hypothetical protein
LTQSFGLADSEKEHVKQVWDEILDILIERMTRKSVPIYELKHLTDELQCILSASKGKKMAWSSVIDVARLLMRADATVGDFRSQLSYNESTIYRALRRLQSAWFCPTSKRRDDSGSLDNKWREMSDPPSCMQVLLIWPSLTPEA